jgi:hypothetical protein
MICHYESIIDILFQWDSIFSLGFSLRLLFIKGAIRGIGYFLLDFCELCLATPKEEPRHMYNELLWFPDKSIKGYLGWLWPLGKEGMLFIFCTRFTSRSAKLPAYWGCLVGCCRSNWMDFNLTWFYFGILLTSRFSDLLEVYLGS